MAHAFLHANALFSDTAVKIWLALMKYLFNRRTWETPNRSIWEPVTAEKYDNLFTITSIEPRSEWPLGLVLTGLRRGVFWVKSVHFWHFWQLLLSHMPPKWSCAQNQWCTGGIVFCTAVREKNYYTFWGLPNTRRKLLNTRQQF